ncbi:MAG: GNAT family N-acetyltransferase [Chloroflexi bacterium]|nr:GNAT family N-acetyltransferase [Chloroflexota bacterium]
MHIRYYHPEDDAALMALERRCPRGLPEPFVHYRRRFIDRAAIFSDHQLLVAEDDGQIVGTVAMCVKRTQIGGRPVSLGYVFDVRTDPTFRRRGIGAALVEAVDDYLIGREVDGVYGHILSTNVASLALFAKLGYQRVRQILMLSYQPFPVFELPDWLPRHSEEFTCDADLVTAVHSARDLYVPDVAERVKNLGYQRWSVDLGNAQFAGISLFDQSYVFQQWPAHLPFPTEEEMRERGNKSLRLFNEVGTHHAGLLHSVFATLRDQAVEASVSKLTLLIDRMDRVPTFLFAEADKQLDYWMVFKSLRLGWAPEWQDGPIYVDAREL